MGSSTLKVLRPLNINDSNVSTETRALMERLNPVWAQLIELGSPDVLHLCESIYYKTLEHYVSTLHAVPLAYLNRSFNRRLITLRKRYALPPFSLNELVNALYFSGTLPINLMRTLQGSTSVLPAIVLNTIMNRALRGAGPDNAEAVMLGSAAGPVLSDAGVRQAYAPFVELDEPAAPSDNYRHIDHELDNVGKSVDSVDNSPDSHSVQPE